MAVGMRFDLEAAKEEARLKKQRELTKKIVSNVVMVVVLVVIGVGLKIGWNMLMAKRAAEEAARQEAERVAAEKARVEKEKKEKERKERAEKARREAEERKAAEEKAKAEKEAARERERVEREMAIAKAKAERERAEAERKEQDERAKYAKEFLQNIHFDPTEHYLVELAAEGAIEKVVVEDARWIELSGAAAAHTSPTFFDLLRPAAETNENEVGRFPTVSRMSDSRKALNAERFTMTIRLKSGVGTALGVYVPTIDGGIAEPEGAGEIKTGTKVTGWTVPFSYGGGANVLIMQQRTAAKFRNEWRARMRKLAQENSGKELSKETIASIKTEELKEFAQKVRAELRVEPPKPAEKPEKKNWRDRNREGKGGDSIRGFGRGGGSLSRGGRSSSRSLGGARLR